MTTHKEPEGVKHAGTAQFNYDSSEQEADSISSRFKNSGDVKSDMSGQLGIDFSGVRVHQDADADLQTREMGTAAFTRGNDVFMGGADTLRQTGTTGSQVLAHELTHTVQQGAASQPGGGISQAAPAGTTQMWNGKIRNFFKRHFGRSKGSASNQDSDWDMEDGALPMGLMQQDAAPQAAPPPPAPSMGGYPTFDPMSVSNASYLASMQYNMRRR